MRKRRQSALGIGEALSEGLIKDSHLHHVSLPLVAVIGQEHEKHLFIPRLDFDARHFRQAGFLGPEIPSPAKNKLVMGAARPHDEWIEKSSFHDSFGDTVNRFGGKPHFLHVGIIVNQRKGHAVAALRLVFLLHPRDDIVLGEFPHELIERGFDDCFLVFTHDLKGFRARAINKQRCLGSSVYRS